MVGGKAGALTLGQGLERLIQFLKVYHSYEAFGLENIPRTGPALVVGTHSFATYENFLLPVVGQEVVGRPPYITADSLIFRIPWLVPYAHQLCLIEGKRDKAIELLKDGQIVAVGPGGMRESLRSSRRRYEIDWEGREGFLWTSLLTGAPIVLAACPNADRIFTLYDNPVTRFAYEQFKVPVPVFRGLGPTLIPRPVRLWHVVGKPIYPPCAPDQVTPEIVHQHYERVAAEMKGLIKVALKKRPASSRLEHLQSEWGKI